jgi:DNA (cytosine-5)-methyltransferase 1
MLKVLELFAGIGACSKALERLGIEHEIVDAVEIDKYAIKSFNAVHGTNFEPQDITKWDKDIQVDLIMHGSPCQDFSVAGKGAGGDKDSGTRSSLMYETLRIVERLKPQYVIWENVKNLLSKKHRHNFDAYLEAMQGLGYSNYYQVLNAKDYGVPQNRERVFTVSIKLNHAEYHSEDGKTHKYVEWASEFTFPEPMPLTKKLADVLEDEVDEKYYLSDEQVSSFKASTAKAQAKGNGFKFEPIERESSSHDRHEAGQSANGQLYSGVVGRVEAINGHDILKRIYGIDGVSPTLSTMGGGNTEPKILENDSDKDRE